ncbi:MAG: DNA recombination protein RmuC [Pseudonocardiaceae bacterium]|nr:DNA recombination protein RmuC [Pseudonocardiaceae bacterium]
MDTSVLIALLAGLVAGGLLAWLLAAAARRAAVAEARRSADSATATAESELAGARRDRDSQAAQAEAAEQRAEQAGARTAEVQVELASARASLEAERAAAQERQRRETEVTERLKESFQALSAEALSRNNETFVQLAEARIKEATASLHAKAEGDATTRQQAIESMLNPVAQTLHRVEGQLRDVEKERERAYAGLREQVGAMHQTSEKLQTETRQLVTALRAPQVRGRWGELQLERIVELAGMVEHCDFDKQVSATDAGGDADAVVRPDLVVHLAGGKQIVLDAKVPFAAYLEATDATDPDRRNERLAAHARQLRTHVDQLAGKSYWQRFEPTPEFVVLFVPGDPFLEAALQSDPALLEHAFERNVVVATPTTLIALLRTVAYTWRQEALARNAAEVHSLGRELHARLATMGGHVAKLGRQLTGAVDSYNRTVSSLESRVLVTARRFADLQVVETELDSPEQVERTPRTVAASELSAPAPETCLQGRSINPETGLQGRSISTDSLIALEHRVEPDRYGVAGPASRHLGEESGEDTVSG